MTPGRLPAVSGLVDRAMDFTVLPGFSRIGYGLRRRMFEWQPPELSGRSVMVTGASSGLGEAAAIDLARCGAKVHMVCRNEERGERARARVNAEAATAGTDREPVLHLCDLSLVSSIREFASGFLASETPLDVVINNAGVMPSEREQTEEGFELTFATNVIGPYLLTELLLPRLREGKDPRVIVMSSGGMYSSGFSLGDPQLDRRDYRPTGFYAHTKRAEVMMADAWQRREPPGGVTFCSMHPGWAVTPGMSAALPGFHRVTGPILRDAREGADTAVWLAGATADEAPGGLFYEDRRPRAKERIPGTAGSREDGDRLLELLAGITSSVDVEG
ncbi:MAG: SDR family NAD(P)-dependent oxidoreductase [Solirubrobacterales bacterium]|nr:SDR family NAD(P)-dependent oxidoreductase [Solirubrobacterales bacterium]MCB0859632.1 SDR family NAD(P)-dependent oxidoreductase [Solirubrobacterales bacterium]HRV59832.1 SDR family NAD(P)-dependent oxidoreductase [Solirubrobacterales bacterium]